MENFNPTERTQLKRLPARGSYEREVVNRILDEGLVCHVGFVANGEPFVIPTGYGRAGETLYVHGSAASRMLRTLAGGVRVCVTVTLLDGLVLARSAFHHSMNYRSVVVFGTASVVEDAAEKAVRRGVRKHHYRYAWTFAHRAGDQEEGSLRVTGAGDQKELGRSLLECRPTLVDAPDDADDLDVGGRGHSCPHGLLVDTGVA